MHQTLQPVTPLLSTRSWSGLQPQNPKWLPPIGMIGVSTDAGCVVEQQFEHLPDGLSGIRLQAEQLDNAEALVAERRNILTEGMTQTLERIRAVLER
jgi:hypothetical protein